MKSVYHLAAQLLPREFCEENAVWSYLRGAICVEQSAWSNLRGAICVEQSAWSILCVHRKVGSRGQFAVLARAAVWVASNNFGLCRGTGVGLCRRTGVDLCMNKACLLATLIEKTRISRGDVADAQTPQR
jgi:hypothetical protein